ncbi:esterase [Comamonas serinivorans]|uniref:Esterase n=1 Tax=Comamonas serinivorans TaxID=1082851 RepID=A0A1Y0EL22_9BURK|nr:alpha/beta hydrolase [Comamonas serinivorans]ARU04266.1 esterase [Comamonas serinivorans]
MPRVTVNVPSVQTSVLDDGQGRPTLLIHGTSSSAEMGWAALLPRLSAKRRCLAFDMLGSGETEDHGQAISLDVLVAQAVATAGLAPDGEIDIVGYSLGAVVAAGAAAAMPDRVRRLVLLGGWAQTDARMRLQFDLWAGLSRTDKRQLARLLLVNGLSEQFFQLSPPEVIAVSLDRFTGLLAEGGARQAELDATVNIRALLPKIQAQTLVIAMQQDRLVPPEHCRELADGIAGARFESLDCGHLVMLEQPEALLDLIERHLDA